MPVPTICCSSQLDRSTPRVRQKSVAIVQSNYIPWKGYFDLIAAVDEFILYDDVQFTARDWRNRNKIKTPIGLQWLTIPVGSNTKRRIRDVVISDPHWQEEHWTSLARNYRRATHYAEIAALLEPMYLGKRYKMLSELNRAFVETVCNYLGIRTRISNSWDYALVDGRVERLLELCRQAGAMEYVSGPAAQGYLNESVFTAHNISVRWFEYANYPEYPQLWGAFEHGVSIVDLLFNCGPDAARHMKYVNP